MNQQELEVLAAEWRQAKEAYGRAVAKKAAHKYLCPPRLTRYPSIDAYNEYENAIAEWEAQYRVLDSETMDAYGRLRAAETPLWNALPVNAWIGLRDGTEVGRTQYHVICRSGDTSEDAPEDSQEESCE